MKALSINNFYEKMYVHLEGAMRGKFNFKNRFKRDRKKRNSWLRNIKIGRKYGLVIVIIFLLFAVSTSYVTKLIVGIEKDVDILDEAGDKALKISEMNTLSQSMGLRIANYVHYSSQKYVAEYEDRFLLVNNFVEEIKPEIKKKEQIELLNQVVGYNETIHEKFKQDIIPAVESGDYITAKRTALELDNLQLESVAVLDTLRDIVNDEKQVAIQRVNDSQQGTFFTLIASMIVSFLIGSILVYLISRMISRNLEEVVEVSNKIASGDLIIQTIDYDGKDEIGQIALAVNTMGSNLRQMIHQIFEISNTVINQSEVLTHSANEVREGSEHIASTMQNLALGTDTQSDHISSLSSIMGDFAEMVNEANKNGDNIFQTSKAVLGMTEQGRSLMDSSIKQMVKIDEIVNQAVLRVQGLEDQSHQISRLVSVINDISGQTNLLALNAAIEAARAGEHGKGFAVVANEVRKLAEQVGISSNDITTIVQNIQAETDLVTESLRSGYIEVKEGTNQIKYTGQTFTEISHAVNTMTNKLETITSHLMNISSTTKEMNGSLQNIAAISQESAAGVEETSSTTEESSVAMEEVVRNTDELTRLARELDEVVRKFKL
jgi:methyl-accepting chemotaxis protein